MPRHRARSHASIRAALPALLIAALVAACAPSAEIASPAARSTSLGRGAISAPSTVAAHPTPTAVASATPTVQPDEDDDVRGVEATATPVMRALVAPSPTSTPTPTPASVPSPTPVPTPDPTPTPLPTPVSTPVPTPLPPKKPLDVNLYHKGDWVGQYTLTWCVGASIQMMVNIALPGQDRTKATQAGYMLEAQGGTELSNRGAGSWGWAQALTDLGVGQYMVAYEYSFEDALRRAAIQMRATKRPVGLLVWGGKHAWVMTGFTSIGDPLIHPDFEVTGVRVLDPLYPRHNADLGPAPGPNALLKPSTLDNYFVGWSWWGRKRGQPTDSAYGSWRLVIPIAA